MLWGIVKSCCKSVGNGRVKYHSGIVPDVGLPPGRARKDLSNAYWPRHGSTWLVVPLCKLQFKHERAFWYISPMYLLKGEASFQGIVPSKIDAHTPNN